MDDFFPESKSTPIFHYNAVMQIVFNADNLKAEQVEDGIREN